MSEAEDIIQELIENINFLQLISFQENIDNEEDLELFIENVTNLFAVLKEAPPEISIKYESQMSDYCQRINNFIESLNEQQTTTKEEIELLTQKIKAHKLYSR
jgi:hypothetical protein